MSRRSIVILVILTLAFIMAPTVPLTDSGTDGLRMSEPRAQEGASGSADSFGGTLHVTTVRTTSAWEHVQLSAENDTTPPSIGDITWSPSNPLSNEAIDVYVTVTDESGVDRVLLDYYDGSLWRNLTMGVVSYPPPQYWASIPALGAAGTIEMWVLAWDLEGNLAWTDYVRFDIQQGPPVTTTPFITTSTTTVTTGELFIIVAAIVVFAGIPASLIGWHGMGWFLRRRGPASGSSTIEPVIDG